VITQLAISRPGTSCSRQSVVVVGDSSPCCYWTWTWDSRPARTRRRVVSLFTSLFH